MPPLDFASNGASVYHFAMNQIEATFPLRRRRGFAAFAGLMLIACLMITGPQSAAQAQSPAAVTGTLDATAQGAIPKGAAIDVRAPSGAPEVQAMADLFRDALENSGYSPGNSGDSGQGFILNFQITSGNPGGGAGSALELSGNRGSGSSGNVDLKMRWKTKPDKTRRVRRDRQLLLSIEDGNRNLIWQARLTLHAGESNDVTAVDAVMPALIANLGRTVYALRVP